ncbi:MAG TPA: ABC transporter permease [Patescibacteria group bacterium]|nr:ABC transporter permease [Patescibacteria group bacterium]
MKTHFQTMWHHVRRSPYQALAAVMIMIVTFLAVSVFTILIIGSSQIISYFESKPQVTAFFRDEAKQTDIDNVKNQLLASGEVTNIKFVSKQQALQMYQAQNKNDPLLLDLVTADILPASLEISTKQLSDLQGISDALKKNPMVQEVVFQQDVVSTLMTWTNTIRYVGIGLIVVLSLVSILIMTTIIGIKISQKKEEIEVMQLLGATRRYIGRPFVFEGIFYGFVGACTGWFVVSIALFIGTPYLEEFLRGIPLFPVPLGFYAELLGSEILLAILLGWFASKLAVSRYIK